MHTSHALGGLRAAVVAAASAAVVNVAPGQRDRAIAEAAKEVSISSALRRLSQKGPHEPHGVHSGGQGRDHPPSA
jgi:hypothetical protein